MAQNTIKQWALDDRPREKMILKGSSALSNAELLAILINNGTTNASAVELAKNVLHALNNNLTRLAGLSVAEILQLKIKGIGPAKAVTIAAALELGIRTHSFQHKKDSVITSKDAADYLKAQLQHKTIEMFVAIYLNRANKIIKHEVISTGGITGTVADPRIILRKGIECNASSLILSHNHPSGNLNPSMADKALTQKIKQAAILVDMVLLDHIIVSHEGYFSFADEGIL
ncbi:MAG: DNA repair protein RadC [Bacteroidota bacterium]|jgi:DNA repair protein RadC|nr:DNA repair protein RadC [Bacteroidota bacterium]